MENLSDINISDLKNNVLKEKQMNALAEDSCSELLTTIAEYEKRLDAVNYENNEWKTRYDIQKETNDQISKQILIIQDKIQKSKNQLRDAVKVMRSGTHHESDLGEISVNLIKTLQEEKDKLVRQKDDIYWRIDQETKSTALDIQIKTRIKMTTFQSPEAFHRANEQRKIISSGIVSANENINELKYMIEPETGSPPRSPKQSISVQPRTEKLSTYNPMIPTRVPKLSTVVMDK